MSHIIILHTYNFFNLFYKISFFFSNIFITLHLFCHYWDKYFSTLVFISQWNFWEIFICINHHFTYFIRFLPSWISVIRNICNSFFSQIFITNFNNLILHIFWNPRKYTMNNNIIELSKIFIYIQNIFFN